MTSTALKLNLSSGLEAIIDRDDYEEISKFKWHAVNSRGKFYAVRNFRIGLGKNNRRLLQMHRFILGLGLKGNSYEEVDHINGNSLDNRKSNLRVCNQFSNKSNRRDLNNLSGIYRKSKKGYSASIWHVCKKIHIGLFPTKRLAHNAYVKMSRKLKGKFSPYAIEP